jgi:hypothetical protein
MAHEMYVIRFPDGKTVFQRGSFAPVVGDRFTRGEKAWVVVRVAPEDGMLGITVMPGAAGKAVGTPRRKSKGRRGGRDAHERTKRK